jgi:hypothetical protein
MRRLAVIAFEDIGLANLNLIEKYLEAAQRVLADGKFVEDDREKVVGFVQALCASPKSRYLTRISATAYYLPILKQVSAEARAALMTDPVAEALNDSGVLTAHAKALACKPQDLGKALRREGFDQLADLMKAGNRVGAEGLPLALFSTRHERPVDTVTTQLPPMVMLGHFPTFVYDRHTRLGSRALKLFVKEVLELAHLTPAMAAWVAYRILFWLESGLLDREVMFTNDAAVEQLWWTTLMVEGLTLPEVFRIRDALGRQLPRLNAIRHELLTHHNHSL